MAKSLRIDNYVIETPLVDIIRRLQLTLSNGKLRDLKESQTELVVTCPNDEHCGGMEAHPDCHINLDESKKDVPYGFFHCFACDVKGTFVKFVALCFSSSESYAKSWLISNYGTEVGPRAQLDDPIVIGQGKKERFLDESLLDKYQTWTPYLAKRRLSREMCENFKVRYDPQKRQVIFPVYDPRGRLKMLARRSVDTKVFYLDKDQEKEVYGLNVIQKNGLKSCLITEGPIDMLSGWTHGVPTIATLGSVSDYQIDRLNKSCITTLYLGFDNDAAGRAFAAKVKRSLAKRIITVDVDLPKGRKDLNELSQDDWDRLIAEYFTEYSVK